MPDKDYKQSERTYEQFDRELDAVLAKFATVEPPSGLENRILAVMRSKRVRTSWHAWWQWSALALAAAVVVMVTFAWRTGKRPHSTTANHPEIKVSNGTTPGTQLALNNVLRTPARNSNARHHHHDAPLAAPKLNTFPSPQPPSEQEIILANYVAHYHRQAVLIARVTNEELKRDRIEVFGTPEKPSDEVADQQTTNR